MANDYRQSFSIDSTDIPKECPICGKRLDMSSDVDISQYEKGFRSVLMCPNCNYKKVLAYITEADAEREMLEEYSDTEENDCIDDE